MWLAPVQVKILPIAERHHDYAAQLEKALTSAGLRVENDLRSEKIGYKIREAQLQKIPYMIVVGDKEAEQGNVAVRSRKEGDLGTMPVEAFIEKAQKEVAEKAHD